MRQLHATAAVSLLVASMVTSDLHAQLGVAGPYYHVVRSGGSIMVEAFADMNPDCTVIGTVSANLIEAPQGGQVSIGEALLYPNYPLGNPRFVCDRHRARHAAIRYRANPGFVGSDRFTVELVFPGGIARRFRWFVDVRAAADRVVSSPQPQATARRQTASCADETSLSSLNSNTRTRITFVNDTSEPKTVYWIDFHGARVNYGTLNNGQKLSLNTYLTHPWVIANAQDQCLRIVIPRPSANYVAIR